MKACLGTKQILSLLLLSINLFYFSSALELGVSPSSIEKDLEINEEFCFSIKVYSDRELNVFLTDYWSKEKTRDISKYAFSSSYFGIESDYNRSFSFSTFRKESICIKVSKEGDFYGLLMIKDNSDRIGVGSWIRLHVYSNRFSGITGNFIGVSKPNHLLGLQALILILLLAIIVFISKKYKLLTN